MSLLLSTCRSPPGQDLAPFSLARAAMADTWWAERAENPRREAHGSRHCAGGTRRVLLSWCERTMTPACAARRRPLWLSVVSGDARRGDLQPGPDGAYAGRRLAVVLYCVSLQRQEKLAFQPRLHAAGRLGRVHFRGLLQHEYPAGSPSIVGPILGRRLRELRDLPAPERSLRMASHADHHAGVHRRRSPTTA